MKKIGTTNEKATAKVTPAGKTANDVKEEKVKNGITELVFILDRSGSMAGLESDTIGGFNAMIDKQKKNGSRAYVSTVLFDNNSYVLHDRIPLEDIRPMTGEDYFVGGCTALLDAIGGAVHHIAKIRKYLRKEDVPENTMFVITTDGMENASREYSSDKVKKMITEKEKEEGWEFLFVGANIDAVETASHFGIRKERAVNYHADKKGTKTVFNALGAAVERMCASARLDDNWSAEIAEDYNSRK